MLESINIGTNRKLKDYLHLEVVSDSKAPKSAAEEASAASANHSKSSLTVDLETWHTAERQIEIAGSPLELAEAWLLFVEQELELVSEHATQCYL